ncbi:uncharacterized protein LOC129906523 isoform X2 [Episyrphus balteatus]|uniref:uncharacterized protein LOC129906523 isoform X2 n=1 Tax=Episyrphus balteatus TaxID=286459 RepID=UPI0024858B6C|nr:uncharacterized protein LOC129906523 isoform X2 [Episyrphus balteatus]
MLRRLDHIFKDIFALINNESQAVERKFDNYFRNQKMRLFKSRNSIDSINIPAKARANSSPCVKSFKLSSVGFISSSLPDLHESPVMILSCTNLGLNQNSSVQSITQSTAVSAIPPLTHFEIGNSVGSKKISMNEVNGKTTAHLQQLFGKNNNIQQQQHNSLGGFYNKFGSASNIRSSSTTGLLEKDNSNEKRTSQLIGQNVFTWGKRMGKKLDILKKSDQKSHSDLQSIFHPLSFNATCTLNKCKSGPIDTIGPQREDTQNLPAFFPHISPDKNASLTKDRQKTLKSFFHRIGSTGMLNHKSHNLIKASEPQLYRSSSTSQLSTCSYVKCDDPSESLLNVENSIHKISTTVQSTIKSSSCDDIAKAGISNPGEQTRRGNFPYAFLRSRLSVLPEENRGSVTKSTTNTNNNRVSDIIAPEITANTIYDDDTCSLTSTSLSDQQKVIYRSDDVIKRYSSDDSVLCNYSPQGNILRNNSVSSKDWEPLYQRLSSCLSSNESGYDSDGGRVLVDDASSKRNSLLPMNSIRTSIEANENDVGAPISLGGYNYDYETETIRRRFRQIKLKRISDSDFIGLVLSPKTVLTNSNEQQLRYLVVEIDTYGIVHKDGRLRLGDEIVNVNGNHLRGLQSFDQVQNLLSTFVDNCMDLVIAHDEVATVADFCTKIKINNAFSNHPKFEVCDGNYKSRKQMSFSHRSHSTESINSYDLSRLQITLQDDDEAKFLINSTTIKNKSPTKCSTTVPTSTIETQNISRPRSVRSLELTPLCSTSEYTPVYANRVTSITNTISDDEKWQILSQKRAEVVQNSKYTESLKTSMQDRCNQNASEIKSYFYKNQENIHRHRLYVKGFEKFNGNTKIKSEKSKDCDINLKPRLHYNRNSMNHTNSNYRSLRFTHSRLSSSRLSLYVQHGKSDSGIESSEASIAISKESLSIPQANLTHNDYELNQNHLNTAGNNNFHCDIITNTSNTPQKPSNHQETPQARFENSCQIDLETLPTKSYISTLGTEDLPQDMSSSSDVLRAIFGPACIDGDWRRRYNNELYGLYKDANLAKRVKVQRLRWLGHVERMDNNFFFLTGGNLQKTLGSIRHQVVWDS